MAEGTEKPPLLPERVERWENLAVAFSEGGVRAGMKIEPYYGPQVHAAAIRNILYDQHSGRPYIEIEPGRHFYDESSFRFYRVNLDGRGYTKKM